MNLWLPDGKGVGKDRLGVWDWYVHISIFKIIDKDLLCSTGNYIQYSVITYIGKESEKEYIYIYMCVCAYIYIYIYNL